MQIIDGSKGQTHPIYNLVGRHQPLDFRGSLVLDELPGEEWLEVVEDVMRIFTMM